ncbi:conserved protein of unknown function [Pseudomonas marincola]|uniref:Uncharacterized protein n=1 Tax=Pseudomonas marincola TaxID=437900 RepID=A0A653E3S4_9PSED|nr:conserved protein of unknown function [Pseudomonas marincola]
MAICGVYRFPIFVRSVRRSIAEDWFMRWCMNRLTDCVADLRYPSSGLWGESYSAGISTEDG